VLRTLIVLASLAAAVAFAAQLREHRHCEDARAQIFRAVLTGAPTAKAIAQIRSSCRGTTAKLAVAGALTAAGDRAQALPLAREAAEAEPENPAAWRALAAVASGTESREAERRLRALNPSLNDSAGRSTR
jgi:Flp pilus assembly protein TadD